MNRSAKSLKLTTVMFRAFSQVQTVIKNDIADYGLNTSEFGTLEVLYHKGALPIQGVGELILMANSSMTYVVDKLEKRQFIRRFQLPSDRRSVMIELTNEGRTFFETIFESHKQTLDMLYGGLSDAQKDLVIESMKTIGFKAEETNRTRKKKG
ncbi:MAG: MarR family transcriptional regulator [Acholeplasmataceae bacterium]|nr:MarR family transcriptional regulator [Acholeplasmataceae bacterium]